MYDEQFLTLKQVLARTAHGRTAFYDAMHAGTYPKARKRGRQALWLKSEIEAAMRAEIDAMDGVRPV